MANQQLRLGVIGSGWAGRQAVLAANAGPRTVPVAVADLDPARSASVAQEFSIAGVYQTYDDLLQDPAVEAVYIATPPDGRLPLVLAALAAGKHVLVQKPHATHAAEILEMEQAAHQYGKVLQFCFFKRHNPKYRQIRQAVLKEKIGEPYHARIFVKFNSIPPLDQYSRWLHVYGQKGGALGQHASHELDLVWWWMGCPTPEWAFGVKHTISPLYDGPEGPAEDYFSGLVGLAGGKTIQVDCSRMLHSNTPNVLELYGTTGAITGDKLLRAEVVDLP